MESSKYVISVKRTKNYNNEDLSPEMQYFEYVGFDTHSGPMSTGYPCFISECHAHRFDTEDAAKAWWDENKGIISRTTNMDRYDLKTLAIRKVSYRKIKQLNL